MFPAFQSGCSLLETRRLRPDGDAPSAARPSKLGAGIICVICAAMGYAGASSGAPACPLGPADGPAGAVS